MSSQTHTGKKLYRALYDRKLAGVCGGIGAYLDIDPTLIRLGWIVLTILTGIVPGVIGYIIATIVMPVEPLPPPQKSE